MKSKTKVLTITQKDYDREIAAGVDPKAAMRPGKHKFRKAVRFASPEDVEKRNIKLTVSIRLDADIVDFFKARASAPNAAPYQTQINAALRAFIEGRSDGGLDIQQSLLRNETFVAALADRVREHI